MNFRSNTAECVCYIHNVSEVILLNVHFLNNLNISYLLESKESLWNIC